MNYSNGKATVELEKIEPFTEPFLAEPEEKAPLSAPKKAKKQSGHNNPNVEVRLDIDAGARRLKFRLNGELRSGSFSGKFKSCPAEAKKIKGEVPLKNDGCFSYNKSQYVVGSGIERVNGDLIVSSQDNKITHLDIWVLGAIAHYRSFLKKAAEERRRENQPVQLALRLRVLTLSSPLRREIEKALKAIETFFCDDVEYNIKVKSCTFLDEGEGAAYEIINVHKADNFHLLDLGGGTITFTSYEWDGDELSTIVKVPVSGGGMTSLIKQVFKALTRTDRAATQTKNTHIQLALEASELREGQWYVPLRSNGQFKNIAEEVQGALSEWVHENSATQELFDVISQKIARGEKVFCSGGGFAIKIVADWIIKYLLNDIRDRKIAILDNPQDVNLAGLHWRDKPQVEKD